MARELCRELFLIIIGISFFGLAFWTATAGFDAKSYGLMLATIPLFLMGLFIVWKRLFALAVRPFVIFIESIYLPGGKLAKPVLNLKLPAYYLNEGRYTEALEEYRKIVKHHPDEVEAYERLIWLHCEIFDEVDEAKRLVRRAKRRHLVLDQRVLAAVTRR